MTREQERQILRQNMNHYLWNKPRAKWTEQDLINLEGKSISGKEVKSSGSKQTLCKEELLPLQRKRSYKQPVVVKSPEGNQEYGSVALCAAELEIEPNAIYARLNGYIKNKGQYQFFKSKINQ